MPPPATTRSQWVGLNGASCFLSISRTLTNAENSLHARQNSNGPSPSGSPAPINTLLPPAPSSSGPPPPDSDSKFHIAGLSRSIFIAVIVTGVVALTVLSFLAVCCFKRWKHNRSTAEHTISVQMHDIDHTSHFGDAPRPDSTTLPMRTAPQPKPDATLPGNAVAGSPLGTMLNRFHSPSNSASHRRLGSGDSTYSSRVTAWDNDHPTRTVSSANAPPTPSLCGPTSSSGMYKGVPMSSQPSTPGPFSPVPFSAYRSPSITSLESNPPQVPARGKRPFRDTIMAVPRPLSISNRLRKKKIRPITENKAVSEPALGAPVASFAGLSRASAGSMSNWVSWWESSSDEEEEEEEAAATKRKKRKK